MDIIISHVFIDQPLIYELGRYLFLIVSIKDI